MSSMCGKHSLFYHLSNLVTTLSRNSIFLTNRKPRDLDMTGAKRELRWPHESIRKPDATDLKRKMDRRLFHSCDPQY